LLAVNVIATLYVMDETISWEAPEYPQMEKNVDWYWTLGIVAAALVVLAVVFNNILVAILIAIATVVMGIHSSQPPRIIKYELRKKGIVADAYLYTYDTLDSFWIEEHLAHPKIILKSKKTLMPYIYASLGDADQRVVRNELLKHIPEIQHHESFGHKLFEYLGF